MYKLSLSSEVVQFFRIGLEIVKFFETKEPPFPNEDTLEMFAFMDAAQRSKEAGGAPQKLR